MQSDSNSNLEAVRPLRQTITTTAAPTTLGLQTLEDMLQALVAGKLSPHTRRAYLQDAQTLVDWLQTQTLTLPTLTKTSMEIYRRS